jgi:VanZ family protein
MSDRSARAERAARRCLHAGFWIPLAVCTWLALTPSPPQPTFRVSDVVLHALAFSYLTFALGLAYPNARRLTLAGWLIGYGLFIEVVQSFESTRSAELKDLLVDGVGIGVGLLLLKLLGDWSRRTVRSLMAASIR